MFEKMPALSAALDAYHTTARALDIGMRRNGGATLSEWAANDKARLDLVLARAEYMKSVKRFNEEAAAFLVALRRSMR